MHCPTCDSPLPVGAMFCGVCGRAVTSADVAAAAARRDEGAGTGSGAGAQAEPPAWQLRQPPRPTTSGDAPWWVRDRRVEQEPVDQAPVGAARDEAAPDRDRGDERAGGERRAVEAGTEEAPPAWIVPARSVESTGADATLVDREAEARARQDDPSSAEPSTQSPSEVAEPAAPAPAPLPAEPVAPAAAPAPAPAPLRAPAPHADNGPRPTSAPLWTASFSRLPSEDDVPAPHDETPPAARPTEDAVAAEAPGQEADPPVGVRHDGARPEGGGAVGTSAAADGDDSGDGHDSSTPGTTETSTAPDETPGPADPAVPVPGADDGEDTAEPEPSHSSEAAPHPGPDASEPGQSSEPGRPSAVGPVAPVPLREPAPAPDGVAGDTAPVTPLPRAVPGASPAVAPVPDGKPVPLVEPGQQKVVEHCTHCGALLDEDDIFCPECGAVVQSVALSFTGPVAPLPPEWRPSAAAPTPTPAPAPAPAPDPENVVDAGGEATPFVDEHRAELPPERQADRPTAPSSEPPVQPGAVPGRWAGAPGGDGATGLPDLPPMPTAAPASALSGLLAGDARSRLVTDDDVDETRLVRRGPVGTEYLFQFSTGESVTVDGSGLLGRAPSSQPGERFDHLVRIADPGKSVSKTHLEFGQELGALWVSDRWSGNGTVVRPHEQPARRVEPGMRVRVARGTRVEIGEQFFIVS